MRKFKKALAFALASAMIVSVVPVSAATSNTAKAGKSTIYYNGNASYKSTWVKTTTKKGYTTKFFNRNAKVATLNKKTGKVTAKKAGTAQIKVNFYKSGKYVGNKIVKISVKKAPVAYGIKLENAELTVGETTKVTTSNGVKVNCYSGDKSIATVNKTTGEVKAVAPGTVKIAVRNAYTSKKVDLYLTVKAVDAPVAKQTGRNKITVTNGVSMKDRKVSVMRGNETVALAKENGVVFTEDGTGITITTAANLANTTYTVKVDDKTSEVKGELSRVEKISILSDKAAAIKNTSGAYREAQVGYKVENQFGEDITTITSLSVSGSDNAQLDSKNHRIKFSRLGATNPDYIIGRDIISVVLVHTETGKSAQATLTVSQEGVADSIEFNGVWNREGKAFNDDVNLDENPFYLLFTVKDQYGMKFKDYKNVTLNTDLHVSVLGGLTGLAINPTRSGATTSYNDDFVVITKDGVDYLGLRVRKINGMDLKSGTAQVLAISGGSGKSVQADFELQVGGRVESISINPPAYLPAGEKVELDYTALDANGNAVTSYEHLNQHDVRISGSGNLSWKKGENGKALLVWDGRGVSTPRKGQTTMQSYTFETLSHKFTNLQLTVNEQARPVAIDGLRDVSTSLSATSGAAVEVKVNNLRIVDQYGREMSKDLLNNALKNTRNIYQLATLTAKIEGNGRNVIKLEGGLPTTNTDPSTTRTIDLTTASDADEVLFKVAIDDRGSNLENVAAILNLEIQNGESAGSNDRLTKASQDVRFEVVKTDYIENAQVEVGKIYVPTNAMQDKKDNNSGKTDDKINDYYKQNIIVKHQGAVLPASNYTVSFERNDLFEEVPGETKDGLQVHAMKLKAGKDQNDIAFSSNQEVKTKVYITLKSGEKVTQEVVLSKEAPKVTKINTNSSDMTWVRNASGSSIDAKALVIGGKVDAKFEDQYGKEVKIEKADPKYLNERLTFGNGITTDITYSVEDYKDYNIYGEVMKVTNNGKSGAHINITDTGNGIYEFNLVIGADSVRKSISVTSIN